MFFRPDLKAFEVDGDREFHHWHAGSEKFASVSQLYSAVLNGWQISTHVIRQQINFSGMRGTALYYFELKRDEDYMTMPVQENPALMRFIMLEPVAVVAYTQVQQPQRLVANA